MDTLRRLLLMLLGTVLVLDGIMGWHTDIVSLVTGFLLLGVVTWDQIWRAFRRDTGG